VVLIRKHKEAIAVALTGPYDCPFKGKVVRDFALRVDGTVTATGGGAIATLTLDAPWPVIGRIKYSRNSEKVIDLDPVTYYHLSGLLNSRYPAKSAATPAAGATGVLSCEGTLPLSKLFPGCMIDARLAQGQLSLEGTVGGTTDYAASFVSSASINVRPSVFTSDILPEQLDVHLVPYLIDIEVDISSTTTDIPHVFDPPSDMVIAAVMLRPRDASASGDSQRSDGMVRKVTIEVLTPTFEGTVYDARWGEGKALTGALFNIEQDVLKTGVIMAPILDRGQARRFSKGSTLTVHLDTATTVEADLTAVATAVNDKCVITIVGARPYDKNGNPLQLFT
jgi:hypothetical protein